MHTLTEENYLKAIYKLSQSDVQKVSPTAIAEEMAVNAASVIDMLKKLTEKKLISYDKKTGAVLSNKGAKLALNVVRKHRLWEVFLFDKLKYNWDEIHEIAEQLEHIQNEDLADRLDAFLGFPELDPHGDPIPKNNGEVKMLAKKSLNNMSIGSEGCLVAVKDSSSEFLQYLGALSISIGTKIKVVDKIKFDDSVIIQIEDGLKTMLSQKFAESLFLD